MLSKFWKIRWCLLFYHCWRTPGKKKKKKKLVYWIRKRSVAGNKRDCLLQTYFCCYHTASKNTSKHIITWHKPSDIFHGRRNHLSFWTPGTEICVLNWNQSGWLDSVTFVFYLFEAGFWEGQGLKLLTELTLVTNTVNSVWLHTLPSLFSFLLWHWVSIPG